MESSSSSYRFGVGDKVRYKKQTGWFEGQVIRLGTRSNDQRQEGITVSSSWYNRRRQQSKQSSLIPSLSYAYVVQPNRPPFGEVLVREDTDSFIRIQPENLALDPTKIKPPSPYDPYSFLYDDTNTEDDNGYYSYNENDGDYFYHNKYNDLTMMAKEYEKIPCVKKATPQADNSIRIEQYDGKIVTNSLNDNDKMFGVVRGQVHAAGTLKGDRRRLLLISGGDDGWHHFGDKYVSNDDLIMNFLSIVPTETTNQNELLRIVAPTGTNEKMLQLGDGLLVGVHGWDRDAIGAFECYRAAAYGCSLDELDERDGSIPVGLPEAMIATSQFIMELLKTKLALPHYYNEEKDVDAYSKALLAGFEEKEGEQNYLIYQIIHWTYHATIAGYISPFSMKFSRACEQINILKYQEAIGIPEPIIQTVLGIHKYRTMEMEYEELVTQGLVPRGDPTTATIQLFQPMAMEIFQALPVASTGRRSIIYIEFRELPRVPSPMVVYVLLPSSSGDILKVFRLPDHLQLSPFSEEAFQYAWSMIAYELHLGDPTKNGLRERPYRFTVHDSFHNREFAWYLARILKEENDIETIVELVTHDDFVIQKQQQMGDSREPYLVRLGDIVEHQEERFLGLPIEYPTKDPDNQEHLGGNLSAVDNDYDWRHQMVNHPDDEGACYQPDEGAGYQLDDEGTCYQPDEGAGYQPEDEGTCYQPDEGTCYEPDEGVCLDDESNTLFGTTASTSGDSEVRVLLMIITLLILYRWKVFTFRTAPTKGTNRRRGSRFRTGKTKGIYGWIVSICTSDQAKGMYRWIVSFATAQATRIHQWIVSIFATELAERIHGWIVSRFATAQATRIYQWIVSTLATEEVKGMYQWIVSSPTRVTTQTKGSYKWIVSRFATTQAKASYRWIVSRFATAQAKGTTRQPPEESVTAIHPQRNDAPRGTQPQPTQASTLLQLDESASPEVAERTRDEALLEVGKVIHDHSLAKNHDDACPVCLKSFSADLAQSLVCVLPCGEHALCIECVCSIKKSSDKEKQQMECPLCRIPVDPHFAEDLSFQIIGADETLQGLKEMIPIEDANDREAIIQRLLWTHDFNVHRVVDTLEKIFDDQVRERFFRTDIELNHNQKVEVYQTARHPVSILEDKLDRLVEERRTTFQTARLFELYTSIDHVRYDLAVARKRAREQIYRRLNEVGGMGAENESSTGGQSVILIDYHGMYVAEMISKFEELVKPILPVSKEVTVITGRGLHSQDGESKLKKALIRHIDNFEEDIRWERIESNPGALKILWRPR